MNIPTFPQSEKAQINWLKNLGQQLKSRDEIRNLTVMEQCEILYNAQKAWHNEASNTVKGYWNYKFHNWVNAFMQPRGNSSANNTIDNKISVYRDYIAEETIEAPKFVEIQAYDELGKPIEGQTERIETDFSKCDFTKLLTARGTARRGEMTPENWSMLFDSKVTVTKMLKELKGIGDNEGVSLFYDAGVLYAMLNGDAVPLAQIITDDKMSSLWQEGLELLSQRTKIPMGDVV